MTHPVTPTCYNQCMRTRYSSARVDVLLLILGLACFAGRLSAGAQNKDTFTGIVTHVADGDTLSVTATGRTEVIRLDGIDAPEAGQAFSGQARQRLRVLAFSQPATVHVRDRDRYGRLVARVIVAGRDLSEEMVKAGLAWHYTQYSTDRQLAALEQQARQQHLGLWADRTAVAPWQYRTQHSRGAQGSSVRLGSTPTVRRPAAVSASRSLPRLPPRRGADGLATLQRSVRRRAVEHRDVALGDLLLAHQPVQHSWRQIAVKPPSHLTGSRPSQTAHHRAGL
jgi:micrococcal nuclease